MTDDITTAEGLIDSGHYDEAIALLEVVLAAGPDDPVALYLLGSAHDSAGHEAEAVEPYRRALAVGSCSRVRPRSADPAGEHAAEPGRNP